MPAAGGCMKTLKPPLEAILDGIKHHCKELQNIEAMVTEARVSGVSSPSGIMVAACDRNVGGLMSLLDVLEKMIIPRDKVGPVVLGLREITYRHARIFSVIESINNRGR
jgi:hypothetical protein